MTLVPAVVATVTSTVPAEPAGDVAVQLVVEEQLAADAAVPPNVTVVEPTTKLVPVIDTTVPPATGPEPGDTALTAGRVMNVNWSAGEVTDVPFGVDTVTSTVPAACAGVTTEIEVAELTV